MTVKPLFRWFDFWVGAYYDRKTRTLYMCPLPTIGVALQFGPESEPNVDADVRALAAMATRDRELRIWRNPAGSYGARLGKAPIVDNAPMLARATSLLRETVESAAERETRRKGAV